MSSDAEWNEFESKIKDQLAFWESYLDSGITSSERPLAFTRVETLKGVLLTLSELRMKSDGR